MEQRPYDKVEISPTSRAQCRLCMSKIQRGDCRVGIHQAPVRGQKYWGLYYYHKTCITERGSNLLKKANFESHSGKRKHDTIAPMELIETEVANVNEQKRRRQELIGGSRSDLRELLRTMRLSIARQLDKAPYLIFHDTVLDSLVEDMPSNRVELKKIRGIGEQKCSSLGPIILAVINGYSASRATSVPTSGLGNSMQRQSTDVTATMNNGHDSEDDEIFIETELSIDEIVKRRIREAEAKGEVITL